ncbi:hypothetical protein AGMMS49992_29290 [Clostridia bacterium]|nr:hypothetical protein AGMMS49992_29290 [Clostridia bacterium]
MFAKPLSSLYYTPKEAAAMTGASPQILRILARQDKLPYPSEIRNNRTLFPRAPLDAYIARCRGVKETTAGSEELNVQYG